MTFKVTKKYGHGKEIQVPEHFKNLAEAKSYIEKEIAEAQAHHTHIVFRIYDFDELHSEYDSKHHQAMDDAETGGSGGKGKAQNFRPSPLSTSLRPLGMKNNWVDSDDEDEKK